MSVVLSVYRQSLMDECRIRWNPEPPTIIRQKLQIRRYLQTSSKCLYFHTMLPILLITHMGRGRCSLGQMGHGPPNNWPVCSIILGKISTRGVQ